MSEKLKLDKLDQKILHHLDVNSRIPSSQLAKKLNVSREVADYRIKRLIDNKIFRRFFTHIHSEKFGYTSYKVYLKIKGMDVAKEEELIDFFCKHDRVFWVIAVDGAYDLIVHIVARDVYRLNEILQDCLQKYDPHFISKDITITTKQFHAKKKFLAPKQTEFPDPIQYGGEKGFLPLNDTDKEILRWLSNNARMSATEIAKKVKLTSSAVIYRIKELEKKGIISGYSCTINANTLDIAYSKIMLTFRFGNKKKEKELQQYCLQHKNVNQFLQCIGRWDFEIDVMMNSTRDVHDFIMEVKNRFSDIIRNCESVLISESYKFDHFPAAYPSSIQYS